MDKVEETDKKIEGNYEGEIHAADEEHKHHPQRLSSDAESDDDEEEDEGEEQEIEGANYTSLAKAIEAQSDYIRGLIEEFKVLRTELHESIKRPQTRKSPNRNKKKAKNVGKRKNRR